MNGFWLTLLGCWFSLPMAAVDPPLVRIQDEPPASPREPLAVVQGFAITMAEVRYLLSKVPAVTTEQRETLESWSSLSSLPPEIVAATTEQWIERLLVLSFLERHQLAVPLARVESDLRSWDERLQQQGSSLAQYRLKSGMSHESLLRHRCWEMSWQAYVGRRLSEPALQKYFQTFGRDFDGTRRRVAHLVLVDSAERPATASREKLRQQLQEWRQKIQSGELSFAAAAAGYSQGASADSGGDLGWILRDGPLVEPLSKLAFRLEIGQVSQPIDSPHGVHLLLVLAEEPGEIPFNQVKERVYQAALQDLWQTILEQERPHVTVIRTELE